MHLAPAHVVALASAQEDDATQRSRPLSGEIAKHPRLGAYCDRRRAGRATDLPALDDPPPGPFIRPVVRRQPGLLPRRRCRPAPRAMEPPIAARTRAVP